MSTTKRTLRKLPAVTRKYARLCNDLQSVLTRLKNFWPSIQELELAARADAARELHQAAQVIPEICDLATCPFNFKTPTPGSQECQDCGRPIQDNMLQPFDTSISTPGTGEGRMP